MAIHAFFSSVRSSADKRNLSDLPGEAPSWVIGPVLFLE